jgi:hypothetical protein
MSTSLRIMIGITYLSGLAVGTNSVAQQTLVTDKSLPGLVESRIQAWQPTADERRFDQIAWAKDLGTAQKLAKEHGRPIFLFSYSGSAERENAMALERC